MLQEGRDAIPNLTAEDFKGSTIEAEYKRLSPTPDQFPQFVERLVAADSKGNDLSADQLQSTTAPMFFIHGDADGIRLQHVAEMFRVKAARLTATRGRVPPRDWPSCPTPPM
jgi:hypothetical protein